MIDSIDKVVAFLLGEGTLDGRWFGDDQHTTECGPTTKYWWRQNLRSVRDQIAALCVVPEWLAIESAPKDGTRILVSSPVDGVMSTSFENGCWQNMPWRASQIASLPTHWQPLPPPPAGEKE